MKKSTAISIVIVIIIIAALVFALTSKKADAPAPDKAESSSQTQADEPSQAEESVSGKYVEYNDAELAKSEGDNYLFFHAPWCPQCRAIEESINAGGHIPKDVTIYKVDYDSNQELRKKYNVTLQTTFVRVNNNGDFIDKYVAYDSPSIDSVVENFINK